MNTFRLYVREWVIVYTVTALAEDATPVANAAMEWATEHLLDVRLADPVDVADMRLEAYTDGTGMYWVHVLVFKDNLKGEFRDAHLASQTAEYNGYEEYTVVERNSPADHEIRNHGVSRI